jgi:hypothetical protein
VTPSETAILVTEHFDANYLIQIMKADGTPLVTVGEPAGPGGGPTEFRVWQGLGTTEEGDETAVLSTFGVVGDVDTAWQTAVRWAYMHALSMSFSNNFGAGHG